MATVLVACLLQKYVTTWTNTAFFALQDTAFVDVVAKIIARVWGHALLSCTIVTALTTDATACRAGV